MIGEYVLVRTRSAGVHMGTLEESHGTAVLLSTARRLWSWKGANTLHEISLHGVGSGSKISEAVPSILLTEAIEIIPILPKARLNLDRDGVWS